MGVRAKRGEKTLPAGLSIIHSNRMEDLRQVMVAWVRQYPLNPLENELFIVQSNGMAQWLKLALAEDDGCGISAALDIQLPGRFLWHAYRAVLADGDVPETSPFDRDRLTWRVMGLLPRMLKDDRFASLARFLADDPDQRKRYQLACHLADLFDQYQVYRADWLEDWTSGSDRLANARGQFQDVPPEQQWQPELWRQVQAHVPQGLRGTSRSALHRRFLKAARALGARPATLPRRLIVFGISSLPQQALEALHALSRFSQVLVFVQNPCRHYWADIIEDRELLRIENARHHRKAKIPLDLDPETLHQHVNPLLADWGRQGRDYIGLLYGYDQPENYRKDFAEIDLFADVASVSKAGQPASLLQQVQQAILDLQPLPVAEQDKQSLAPGDRSIHFQLSHSRQREVEILHDQLLSFFEQIPHLNPRDIIVMAPDIDAYAPHIEAVFGNLPVSDPRHIPFTIGDRPEQASMAMLLAVEKLLKLPDSRMAVSDVLDLLQVQAFRERFGLTENNLPRLHQWIEGAGIRWGLSGEQRKGLGFPAGLVHNTWIFGLRRMLLGYAVGAGEPWHDIEPFDEVGGLEADLAGRLAAMLETLGKHCRELGASATSGQWCQRIRSLVRDCFQPANSRDHLTLSRLEAFLAQWENACMEAGLTETLTLTVVRDALLGAMNAASMSQRFLAGRVNFCTLMPMRAIPFAVVCLLGMNDGEYPRCRQPLDFDLMAGPGRYRPGDRSRREDDRYMFLEALLSARKKLHISYMDRSVRDNSERTPSVLVAQLREYLAAGWKVAGAEPPDGDRGAGLLAQLTTRHPLQPFSREYFLPDRPPGLFTYAHEWEGIFDLQEKKRSETPLGMPQIEGRLLLIQLIRFLKNPVKTFFNERLNVYFDEMANVSLDSEPFTVDRLAPFELGGRLLAAGLAAEPDRRSRAVTLAAERLQRTGELPMHGFGELASQSLVEPVLSILDHHSLLEAQWPHGAPAREILIPVGIDTCAVEFLEDWLDGLRQAGAGQTEAPESVPFARWEFYHQTVYDARGRVVRPHSLVGLWVRHLAGCALGLDLTSYLVAPDGTVTLASLDRQTAGKRLADIIGHWWQGLHRPLPVTARTAMAYLRVWLNGDNTLETQQRGAEAVRKAYQGDGFQSLGELGYSPYLARSFPDFNALWEAEKNRFTTLAMTLYAPLITAIDSGSDGAGP
ncbi:MAG: exodeoxyribonuclease V subunit gamma [Desulfobacterales bacterium]|nr:exodeoxyribonuclease V subunit gamma [Desulfobacterales bacterium]